MQPSYVRQKINCMWNKGYRSDKYFDTHIKRRHKIDTILGVS